MRTTMVVNKNLWILMCGLSALLILSSACGEKAPQEIQSACKDSALFNTFLLLQAEAKLNLGFFPSEELRKNVLEKAFYKSIEEARESIKNYAFSKAKRADGKSFFEWKRNEGPIEIVVPHREKDNALTVKCNMSKDNNGQYLFSYNALLANELLAGRKIGDVLKLLNSGEAFAQEKNKRIAFVKNIIGIYSHLPITNDIKDKISYTSQSYEADILFIKDINLDSAIVQYFIVHYHKYDNYSKCRLYSDSGEINIPLSIRWDSMKEAKETFKATGKLDNQIILTLNISQDGLNNFIVDIEVNKYSNSSSKYSLPKNSLAESAKIKKDLSEAIANKKEHGN